MVFEGDHVNGGHADVAENVDEVAAYCQPRSVGVFLLRVVVDTDTDIGGVAVAIGRDFFEFDEDNRVGAFADARDALH
jgi:hypothetical protein